MCTYTHMHTDFTSTSIVVAMKISIFTYSYNSFRYMSYCSISLHLEQEIAAVSVCDRVVCLIRVVAPVVSPPCHVAWPFKRLKGTKIRETLEERKWSWE